MTHWSSRYTSDVARRKGHGQHREALLVCSSFTETLFKDSVDLLREEIKRITGVAVGEAVAEMETTTGAIVHAFTTGTMVQVFQLAGKISADAWNGNGSSEQLQNMERLPR